jgi:hypothetical protein
VEKLDIGHSSVNKYQKKTSGGAIKKQSTANQIHIEAYY